MTKFCDFQQLLVIGEEKVLRIDGHLGSEGSAGSKGSEGSKGCGGRLRRHLDKTAVVG